jgi:hypothetical protein
VDRALVQPLVSAANPKICLSAGGEVSRDNQASRDAACRGWFPDIRALHFRAQGIAVECEIRKQTRAVVHARIVTAPVFEIVARRLLLLVASLAASDAFAQSGSTVLSVTARIVAPCTVTSTNPKSTCSEQTLSQQSDVSPASARISTSGSEATVTHKGGFRPRSKSCATGFC